MSDRNTVKKIQKDKIFNENLFYSDKPKFAHTLQNGQMRFSWPAQLKNGHIFRNWPWYGQSGNPVLNHCNQALHYSRSNILSWNRLWRHNQSRSHEEGAVRTALKIWFKKKVTLMAKANTSRPWRPLKTLAALSKSRCDPIRIAEPGLGIYALSGIWR